MVVDPSKISLKGLFLDPAPDTVSETTGQPGNTVGGTRHIFSNGVMAAKIYLGFSYSASSGDSSTVQDIVDWLAANAEMRLAGDNNTDMGPLPDKGWQFWTADPNGGEYVYDNQVVVPPQMEDFSQPPGGSIWHMPYYLRGPKDSLDGVNVYIRKSADDKSSLNEPLMTIECSHWSFSKDNFELKIDTTTNKFAEFNYKTDGSNDFYEIFNMRFWLNQADCVSPRTNKSASSEDELMNNHYKPFQLRENWFVLSAYQRSAGDYSMTLTVDRNVIGYKPPESYNISSEQVPAVRDGKWINVDYLKLLNWTIVNENQLEPFNGNALLMWQPINADCYYSSGDYLNDLDVYLQNIGGRYVVDIKCRDSFGQNIVAQINLGGDHDCYPDSWSLYGVSQL